MEGGNAYIFIKSLLFEFTYLVNNGLIFGEGFEQEVMPLIKSLVDSAERYCYCLIGCLCFVHDPDLCFTFLSSKIFGYLTFLTKISIIYCDFYLLQYIKISEVLWGSKARISKSVCAFHIIKLLMVSKILYTN